MSCINYLPSPDAWCFLPSLTWQTQNSSDIKVEGSSSSSRSDEGGDKWGASESKTRSPTRDDSSGATDTGKYTYGVSNNLYGGQVPLLSPTRHYLLTQLQPCTISFLDIKRRVFALHRQPERYQRATSQCPRHHLVAAACGSSDTLHHGCVQILLCVHLVRLALVSD